jgi:stage VI sporulation protein D
LTEQSKGLRFDIYERIHLADDTIGISELHDTELIPHIQVIAQDEQALLRGNLMLTGQYVGETSSDKRTFEHLIPVEITLPMSRINSLADILVEIENYDVELLSTRNLNVTGVLSLHGVEISSDFASNGAQDSPIYEQETKPVDLSLQNPWSAEEEVTFSHQPTSVLPSPQPTVVKKPEVHLHQYVEPQIASETKVDLPQPLQADHLWQQQLHEVVEPEVSYTRTLDNHDGYATSYVPPNYEYEIESQDEDIQVSLHYFEPVPEVPVQDEVKEMKVAFGSRSQEDSFVDEHSIGFKSLLKSNVSHEQTANTAAVTSGTGNGTGSGVEASRADSLEWRKLFLREDPGQQEFRKVKMCIIQKEDTLEGIARKYGVNERELQQFNSLTNVDIQMGQIIYIPR